MFMLLPQEERPDSLIRTWFHESIHARRPYAPSFGAEWKQVRGFEEGLAEGLTRLTVVERLGLTPVLTSFHFYVAAYRALATALDIDVEQLWRALWLIPPGGLSAGFVPTVERILKLHGREQLGSVQSKRLAALASLPFGTARASDQPDEAALVDFWRRASR